MQLRDAHWLILLGVGAVDYGVTADEIPALWTSQDRASLPRAHERCLERLIRRSLRRIALLDATPPHERPVLPYLAGARAVARNDEESHGHEKESTT